MKDLKKTIFKLAALAILLFGMNYFYAAFFFEKDLQKYSPEINLVRAVPKDADILYMGESSNNTTRYNDLDKRKISEMTGDFYPDLKVVDITRAAAHAGIFKVLLQNMPHDCNIKTVIVTLNLRSFNAQWIYSDQETNLQQRMVLLRSWPPLVNRFMLSFKNYDIKSDDERTKQFKKMWEESKLPGRFKTVIEWDQWMAQNGIRNISGTKNQKKTDLACHYIKAYAFLIDPEDHPRIKDLDDIVDLARKRNWNLVFNLMAENTEKARKLVGDELVQLMEQNRKRLVEYYSEKGVCVIDNFNLVEDKEFVDQNWTTEHYAEKGRKIVAQNIARGMRKFHPLQYVAIENYTEIDTALFYKYHKPIEFIPVDSPDQFWSQQQTLTSELAFSGKLSSRTGNGNPYSLTFNYPLKLLPDSMKNKIDMEVMIRQTDTNHDAKLVVATEGKGESESWDGVELQEQVSDTCKWEKFSYSFLFDRHTKKAETLKIYIYNPRSTVIYVDDFKIRME